MTNAPADDAPTDALTLAGRPRWRGQPGRLEVHYLTATDTATGDGLWMHAEVVAPTSDESAPYAHGWIARFPAAGSPSYERFGPVPAEPRRAAETWFASAEVTLDPGSSVGRAGDVAWDLTWEPGDQPLWTFPRWAWQRNALPAAQVLPTPTAMMTGTVGGKPFAGPGGTAHIYGHGNAHRWVWLHADLGGGDLLELVAATARRPALRLLPPLPLLQLRLNGEDWPRDPLAAAPLMRASLHDHAFRVRGLIGTRRLDVRVELPADRCVAVPYTDPDGDTATCTNTARADVDLRVDDLTARGWHEIGRWQLSATGHAEIGTRP